MRCGCNLLKTFPAVSKSGNAATAMSGFGRGREPAAGQTLNSAQTSTASDTTVSNGVDRPCALAVTSISGLQDHSGFGIALGRDPVTGKRRTATATVRGTRKDAERELTRLLRLVDTGEHVDPSRMTVRQWLETWLDTVRAEISPKAHERYCGNRPGATSSQQSGTSRLQKLAPTQIQKAYNTWARPTRRQAGGCHRSTRRYIHVILQIRARPCG